MEEYQVQQEQKLVRELEAMKDELAPLEDCRKILAEQAERRANNLTWLGLGLMSVQFGILARLTWWEYSWDIMEPGKNMASNQTCVHSPFFGESFNSPFISKNSESIQFTIHFEKR